MSDSDLQAFNQTRELWPDLSPAHRIEMAEALSPLFNESFSETVLALSGHQPPPWEDS